MSKLSYSEIVEIATSLDHEFDEVRKDARARYELYGLRRDPYVPEEIAREGKVRINSGLVINAASSIRADIMMNPTEFSVIALARERDGAIPHPLEALAENLERSDAIIWGRLDAGRAIDMSLVWHQLVSPYGILCLGFNDFEMPDQPEWMDDEVYIDWVEKLEADWMPWSAYTPDPMTCAWIERDGQPTVFVRRYRTLVWDVESYYSKRRGSMNPEHNLRLDADSRWAWRSDDWDVYTSRVAGGAFRECEMVWLDDGAYIYHVAMNLDGPGGEVVWECPNPVGRPTAFVVPGNVTPLRRMEDKYEPFLWPLMQAVSQINDLRSMRATAARNLAGPNTYIPIHPEIVKLYQAKGEKLPTSVRFRKNETHYLLGTVERMPSELSPDWDKLEQSIGEELQRYLPSQFVNIVDPAVLKAATATSILHAAEAGLRTYGPLMSAKDAVLRDFFEAVHRSVLTYYPDLDLHLHAEGSEMARGRSLKPGSVYRLSPKAVNFPYRLTVRTRSMSQAQAAAQFDLVLKQWILPDGSRGVATRDDLINAANYTDAVAQKMKLAKEAIAADADPFLRQIVADKLRERLLLDSGIDIRPPVEAGAGVLPSGAPPTGEVPGGRERTPSGLPNSAQRMDAPLILGPQGGSDATLGGITPNV